MIFGGVVKMYLFLCQDQIAVESGFSIYQDMLIENLHEESLVGKREVYDGVRENGGILLANIDENLISNVQMANIHYKESLHKRNKIEDRCDTEHQEQDCALEEIKTLKEKKSNLGEAA